MADQQDVRSHNEAQVRGGQHSHSGTQSEQSQPDQKEGKQQTPDREELAEGGRPSHSDDDR